MLRILRRFFILQRIAFAFFVSILIKQCLADSYSNHGSFWSGIPDSTATISQNGMWQTISGSNVTIALETATTVVISYEAMVESFRKSTVAAVVPREGNVDTLQVRCLVDGVPYRFSSGYVSNYGVEAVTYYKISTIFAVNLTATSHTLIIQWKKLGKNVDKWIISNGGNNAGFSIVAHGDFRQVYALQEFEDNYIIQSNIWKPLNKQNLTFTITTEAYVTISYSITIQPQLNMILKDTMMEYLTTRILLNNIAYRESAETFGTGTWNPIGTSLRGSLRLKLIPGQYTIQLQWKKMGNIFKSWGSIPSSIDGFASSRNVIVSIDKYNSPVIYGYDRHITYPINGWNTVNHNIIQFSLLKPSTVVITYALPVSQYGNPNLDRTLWHPLTQLQSRIVVDGIVYAYSGGTTLTSMSIRMEDMFIQLPLVLPAGSHSIALQWKANNEVPWITMNDIANGYAHSEKLLTFITSENAIPSITMPDKVIGQEDSIISITNVYIDDIDVILQPGMIVNVNITISYGQLSFPNQLITSNKIIIEGMNDNTTSMIRFIDTIANINTALAGMTFSPGYLWSGNVTFTLSLSDLGGIEQVNAYLVTKSMIIEIIPIDHMFTITLPDQITVTYHNTNDFTIIPIILQDIDQYSMTTNINNVYYLVSISITCGKLYLNTTYQETPSLSMLQEGDLNHTLQWKANYQDTQILLASKILYYSDILCNTRLQSELFTFSIININLPSQSIARQILIDILRDAIPPVIISQDYPKWKMNGFTISQDNNDTSQPYTIQYVPSSSLSTQRKALQIESSSVDTGLMIQSSSTNHPSSLALLSNDYLQYTFEMAYSPIPIKLLTNDYLVFNQSNSIVFENQYEIVLEDIQKDTLQCILPSLNNIMASLINNHSIQCNITIQDDADIVIPVNKVTFIKVSYYSISQNRLLESNYIPFYVIDPLIIENVTPTAILIHSFPILQLTINLPQYVKYCMIEQQLVHAIYDQTNQVIVCQIPNTIYSNTNATALKVSVLTEGYNIISDPIEVPILSTVAITKTELVEMDISGQYMLVYQGNWSEEVVNSIQSMDCIFDQYTFLPVYIDAQQQIYCDLLTLSTIEIQSCCQSQSCFASLQLDAYQTNQVPIHCKLQTLSSSITSVQTNNNDPVLELANIDEIVQTGFIKFYLANPVNAESDISQWGCIVGNSNTTLSYVFQESDHVISCILPEVVSNTASVVQIIRITDNTVLYSSTVAIQQVPIFTSMSSQQGPITGNTVISIESTNNLPDGNYWCLFDDILVPGMIIADNVLTCSSPSHLRGKVTISVLYNSIFCHTTTPLEYTYSQVAVVAEIVPSVGSCEGGNVITVLGTGFTMLNLHSTFCGFDELTTVTQYINDTRLNCVVPSLKKDTSLVKFILISSDAITMPNILLYRYVTPIVLTSITPNAVSTNVDQATPQLALLVGQGFDPTISWSCYFGSMRSLSTIVINSTHVKCTIPSDQPIGNVNVTVQVDGANEVIQSYDNSKLLFQYHGPIIVSNIQPTNVFFDTPISFTIQGEGFSSLEYYTCSFNNVLGKVQYVTEGTVQCNLVIPSSSSITQRNTSSVGLLALVADPMNVIVTTANEIIVHPLPIITSIYPSIGLIDGGEVVNISGELFESLFAWNRSVNDKLFCRFGSFVTPTIVLTQSQSISCFTPSMLEPSIVTFGLLYNNIELPQTRGFTFMFAQPMSVASISTTHGPTSGGQAILVQGFSFVAGVPLVCQFDSIAVTSRWINSTAVECVTPPHSVGVVSLQFSVPGYQQAFISFSFAYTEVPKVSSITPLSASSVGDTTIMVAGEQFNLEEKYYCYFNNFRVVGFYVNETVLSCHVPALAVGEYAFKLTTDLVESINDESGLIFTVTNVADLLNIVPCQGSITGSEEILLIGREFDSLLNANSTTDLVCAFDDVKTKAIYINSSHISCPSPAADIPKVVSVSLLVDNEISTLQSIPFEFVEPLIINDFHPKLSTSQGGEVITISGFGLFRKDINCLFDDITVVPMILNSTTISCLSPAHKDGAVAFGLEFGNNAILTDKKFTYQTLPRVLSIFPEVVLYQADQSINITVQSFDVLSTSVFCLFNNLKSPAVAIDSNLFSCSIPNNLIGEVDIQLQIGEFIVQTSSSLKILNPMAIQSISPQSVYRNEATNLTVTGKGFAQNVSLQCEFSGESANALTISDDTLVCTIPSITTNENVLSVRICLKNTENCIPSKLTNIPILEGITVLGKSGFAGITSKDFTILLYGYNFPVDQPVQCIFGDETVPGRVLNTTTIECYASSLQNEGNVGYGIVVHDQHYLASLSTLAIHSDIFIQTVSRSSCTGSGGCEVKIAGEGFYSTDSLYCRFGNKQVPALFLSAHEISCVAPSAVPSNVDLQVIVNGFLTMNPNNLTYEFTASQGITSIFPLANWKREVSNITIIGTEFAEDVLYDCTFNNQSVPAIRLNASVLSCTPPVYNGLDSIAAQVLGNGVTISNLYQFIYLDDIFILNAKIFTNSKNEVQFIVKNLPQNLPLDCCSKGMICSRGHVVNASTLICQVAEFQDLYLQLGGLIVPIDIKLVSNVPLNLVAVINSKTFSTEGGNSLQLSGQVFAKQHGFTCIFDDLVKVPIVVEDDSHATCLVPSLHVGEVRVSIQDENDQIIAIDMLQIVSTPVILSVSINSTSDSIIVLGQGFFPDMQYYCAVGMHAMPFAVQFINETNAICANVTLSNDQYEYLVSIMGNNVQLFTQTVIVSQQAPLNVWKVQPLYLPSNTIVVLSLESKYEVRNDGWKCIWQSELVPAIFLDVHHLQCVINTGSISDIFPLIISSSSNMRATISHLTVFPMLELQDHSIVKLHDNIVLLTMQVSSGFSSSTEWLCHWHGVDYAGRMMDQMIYCAIPQLLLCQGGEVSIRTHDGYLASNSEMIESDATLCNTLSSSLSTDTTSRYLNFNESKLFTLTKLLETESRKLKKMDDALSQDPLALYNYDEANYPSMSTSSATKIVITSPLLFAMNECWMNKKTCFDSDAEINDLVIPLLEETNVTLSEIVPQGDVLIMDHVYPRMISSTNGTWITIVGRNFNYDTKCQINNYTIVSTIVSSPQVLTCLIPPVQNLTHQNVFQPFASMETVFPVMLVRSDGVASTTSIPLWHDVIFHTVFKSDMKHSQKDISNVVNRANLSTISSLPSMNGNKNNSFCFSPFGCNKDMSTYYTLPDERAKENQWKRLLFNTTLAKLQDKQQGNNSNLLSYNINTTVIHTNNDTMLLQKTTSMYFVSKRTYTYPCNENCFLEFIGYQLLEHHPWCIQLESFLRPDAHVTLPCMIAQEKDHLICSLPTGNSNMTLLPDKNIVHVLAQCKEIVESYDFDVTLSDLVSKFVKSNTTTAEDVSLGDHYPIVQRITPSSGWISGETLITIYGKHLNTSVVTGCVFSINEEAESVIVPSIKSISQTSKYDQEIIQCRTPTIAVAQKVPLQLQLNNAEIITTSVSFEYQYSPVIETIEYPVNQLDNTTIALLGKGFVTNRGQQIFCKVYFKYSTHTTLLFGRVLSDQLLYCVNLPIMKDLQLRGVSISMNGQDFLSEYTLDKYSASNVVIKETSNYDWMAMTSNVKLPVVQFIGNQTGLSPNISLLNPTSVTLNCNQRNYISFPLLSYQNSYHYACYLDDEKIGLATLQTASTTVCMIESVWPGLHKLQLRSQEEISLSSITGNMEMMLYCLPNPQIDAISILPKDELFFTSLLISGINFQSSMEILCHMDHILVKATIDSSHQIVCSFYQVVSGRKSLEIVYQDTLLVALDVCITQEIISMGMTSIPLTKNQSLACDTALKTSVIGASTFSLVEYKIRSVFPSNGLTFGNTVVTILADRSSRYTDLVCEFGTHQVDALILSDDCVLCHSPPGLPGNATVRLQSVDGTTKWFGGWFIYYPIVVLESIDPILVDEQGGSILNLNVPNLPADVDHIFCHVNGKAIFATAVNATRYACRLPPLYTPIANVSIGSMEEEWSNRLPLAVTRRFQMFSMTPSSGKTFGNTTVQIVVPSELEFLPSNTWCLFGDQIVPAKVHADHNVRCISPAVVVEGSVMVQLQIGSDSNAPTFYVGIYSYLFPAEALFISPAYFEHDKSVQLYVSGDHFVDTNTLSCVFNAQYVSKARWLSKTLLLCSLESAWTINQFELTVQVSNNGFDLSPNSVTIQATEQIIVQKYTPTQGFDLGGDSITITFKFPLYHQLYCQFEGMKSIAIATDTKEAVCVTPRQQPGAYNVTLLDGNGNIFALLPYVFHKVPQLQLQNTSAIVRHMSSDITFGSSFPLPSSLVGRISRVHGEILPSNCWTTNEYTLSCQSISTTMYTEDIVFLDISVNADLFEPRVAAIQVFTATRVVWNDPLLALTTGQNIIQFGVDQLEVGVYIVCHYVLDNQIITETAVRYDENTIQCFIPTVLGSHAPDMTMSLLQFDNVIFGPESMDILQLPVVDSYYPKKLTVGKPETIVVHFRQAITEFPTPSIFFQNQVFELTIVNETTAITYLQSIIPVEEEPLFLIYENIQHYQQSIGTLSTFNMYQDLNLVYEPLARTITKNYTITSTNCLLNERFWCKLDDSECQFIYQTDCQSIVMLSTQTNYPQVLLAIYPDELWNSPVFVQALDVLPIMSVIATRPLGGSTSGGILVYVYGNGFINDATLACAFGAAKSLALFVNETLIMCELPSSSPGKVQVNIHRRGIQTSTSIASFEYIPIFSNITISPTIISSLGGTNLTIGIPARAHYSSFTCRFNQKYVPTSYLDDIRVVCVAPSSDLAEVEFAIALDGADISYPQKMIVRRPLNPVFMDPIVIFVDTPTNISIFFDINNIPWLKDVTCLIDENIVPTIPSSGNSVICASYGLSEGKHSVTLISDDVVIYKDMISTRNPFAIESVYPLTAFADQSVAIEVEATQISPGSDFSICCFGEYRFPAILSSYNRWQCYSPVISSDGGLFPIRKLPVGLAKAEGFCEYSGFEITLLPKLTFTTQSITSGLIQGGTAISINYIPPIELPVDTILCRIGSSIQMGNYLASQAAFVCLTDATPQSNVSIDISINGLDYISTGLYYEYIQPIPVNTTHFEATAPVLYHLNVYVFPTSTAFSVNVFGTYFREDSICILGNDMPLPSHFISYSEIRCDLPIHLPGYDKLKVLNTLDKKSSNSVVVEFVTTPVLPDHGYVVQPSFGPRLGYTIITISLENYQFQDEDWRCWIGEEWSFMFNKTANSVSCTVPPSPAISGSVPVRLGNLNKDLIVGVGYFQYIDDPMVFDITPKRGTYETELVVIGIGFQKFPYLSLQLKNYSIPCYTLSNVRLLCRMPDIPADTYNIMVQTNGQHLVRSGSIFEYFDPINLISLWPLNGPALRGNTMLSITLSSTPSTVDIYCMIDSAMVPAEVISSTLIRCRTPSHRPGIVTVSVLSDGIPVHDPTKALQFAYVPDVSVDSIMPDNGYTAGEFPIFVFGSNFVNSTALACMFADMKSRAIYLSKNSLVCLSPSPLGRPLFANLSNIPVEVTVNGIDFSESGVLFNYSQPCDQGFFCPGMARQLCPNGTYCPINSRNFTLCPPGTFQPMQGQIDCVVCPVGYICPDLGMPRPVNCPPGLICDSMGLRASTKLCPAGFYCLNGTKASSVNEFLGKSEWIQDYVTDVVYFNATVIDWSYHDWPAPAVGRSRAQFPPTTSCDGLVCDGGTTNVLAEAPFPCPIGHYCRAGAGNQIPMPKNFSSPQRCFDGFFCPRGSVSPEGDGPCPNGYFCPTQLDAIVCPPGHYCPGVGNTNPIECYPGTYNPYKGQANCTVCPTGHICPGWGLLLPEPCPAGFVCLSLGLSYPVILCPQGYRCDEGTLTLDPSDPTRLRPNVCKNGEFCLGGVASINRVEWIPSQSYGVTHPQTCSEGTYCQAGAYLSSGTGLCFKGHYCPPNATFPTETPLGNFASGLGSVAPTLCYPGTYAPLAAQVKCDTCPSGHTCTSYGAYIPSICPKGTYRMQVDSVTCVQCPTGTYSYETGAPDLSNCLPCPKGRICGVKEMIGLDSSVVCPAGYICGYGTNRNSQFSHLSPGGYYTPEQTVPENQYNYPCTAGYYCPRGTPDNQQYSGKCTVGSYCPQSTPNSVTKDILCPMVTTSSTQSSVLQNCYISDINVCDKQLIDATKPMEDMTYYGSYTYQTLDSATSTIVFDSSLSAATPTGELQVVKKIYPLNISASATVWTNDTIEAFRACPLYGRAKGGDVITVIGRNFRDSKLNYCKFHACLFSNLGRHMRRCKNQITQPNGDSLPKIGNVSEQSFITRAKYISPTRMECSVPEFIFETIEPAWNWETTLYKCTYVDAWGNEMPKGQGNYSYVRPCYDASNCVNKPAAGQEYFISLTFPCTTQEILDSICSHMPEPDYMFNPCMSAEVAVEVTNDGEHYTGGIQLAGMKVVSTVRYGDGRKIYQNFLNYTVNSTFAVYTYVAEQYFYTNAGIMEMERNYCALPKYMEESEREREQGWFLLKLNEIAKLQIDFSHIPSNLVYDQHYKIAIYAIPSRCTYQLCNSLRVRLSPAQVSPCNLPMTLSNWFESTSVPKNVVNNITVYALDDMLFKVEIQILYGLFAAYSPMFENSVIAKILSPSLARSFSGLSLENTVTRKLSQYVSYEEQLIPMQYFFVAVIYQSDSVEPPLNLPPLYADYSHGRALIMNNVDPAHPTVPLVLDPITNLVPGVEFWLMPATTPDESKELLDAYFETFQGTKFLGDLGYSFSFDTLVLPYFPFFSNCYNYDSYIPIWALLEDADNCALPEGYGAWTRYHYPAILDQDQIRYVGPFDFFYEPIADYCTTSLTCNYEEDLTTTTGNNRWFEQSNGNTVYNMIRYPVNYYQYTGRTSTHVSANDGGGQLYVEELAAISGDNFIPVKMDHTIGDAIVACTTQCFARSYSLAITYYQVDNYNKRIVGITLAGAAYDFDQTNTNYTLSVSFAPLGFLELILNFAFPLSIFIVIFIFVGFVTMFFGFFGWLVCRLCTVLQNPPKLRVMGMLALIVPPPIAGVILAVIPIWFLTSMGNYIINGVFYTDPNAPVSAELGTLNLDINYPLTYNGIGGQITTAQMQTARYGRIGSMFAIIGLFCMFIGAKMFLPREESKREREIAKKRTNLAEKDDLWNPILWQKLNLIYSSIVVATLLVLVVEISYWTLYGTFFYQVIVCLTIFGELAQMAMEKQLSDKLLVAPLACAWTFIETLITFGAPDFYSFLVSNFFGYVTSNFQRVFQDTYIDVISKGFVIGTKQFLRLCKYILPKYLQHPKMFVLIADEINAENAANKDDKDFRKRAVEGVEENGEDHECVEPILDYFNGVCGDTIIVYYFPYLVYLLMQYRVAIQLPILYGIRQSDMMIYMVYQLFQIVFQPFLDILNHAQCELFHGWKIYEYLVYARYRFIQREARWKGMELTLDECIEESLRRVDQMCFSSQYFLMVTMQASGILYLVLAYEVWLRQKYSPFSDAGFFILFGQLFGIFTAMRWILMYLAVKLKIWKIKHETTAWHLQQKEDDDLDVPAWEEIKGASTEAFLMNQRITSDTFRYKFLNYNRTWLINQLPQILTPRTLRRSRPYLINQFARIINAQRDDISDDENDQDEEKDRTKAFGPVSLSTSSRTIIRFWLGKARRRMKLRNLVEPLIKRARGAQCESCLSRKQLQIEYEVELDNMMKMYDHSYPGEEEVDQVQWKQFWINNQRYHTICLACLSKRKEIEARNKMKGGGIFDPTLFDDVEQEAYPDWGPIFLSGASKAILLNWYRKAQKLRAGKRRAPRMKKQREVKDISDDEGEEDPMFSWLREGLKEVTPATKAIAVKWMRTARAKLQQRRGKGTSTREQDEALAELEQDVTEQFKSGKKSRTLRK